VTVVDALTLELAADVAFIVTVAGVGTFAGAVYRPADEIVPQAAPEHPTPDTVQSTETAEVPVTLAANCCVAFTSTVAETGDTLTTIGVLMVNVAVYDLVGSATEVAVTKIREGSGSTAGALYSPPVVTTPHALPEQPYPVTLHSTAVFVVPLTLATNCCCCTTLSSPLLGDATIVTCEEVPIETVVEAISEEFRREVAVIVTVPDAGAVTGA